jgi:hypothetical protein
VQIQAQLLPFDLWQRAANIDFTKHAFAMFGIALALTPLAATAATTVCNDVLRVGYKNRCSYFVLIYSKVKNVRPHKALDENESASIYEQ